MSAEVIEFNFAHRKLEPRDGVYGAEPFYLAHRINEIPRTIEQLTKAHKLGVHIAIEKYFSLYLNDRQDGPVLTREDHLLAWLFVEGFVIRPVEGR